MTKQSRNRRKESRRLKAGLQEVKLIQDGELPPLALEQVISPEKKRTAKDIVQWLEDTHDKHRNKVNSLKERQ